MGLNVVKIQELNKDEMSIGALKPGILLRMSVMHARMRGFEFTNEELVITLRDMITDIIDPQDEEEGG